MIACPQIYLFSVIVATISQYTTETDLIQYIQIYRNLPDWLTVACHRVGCLKSTKGLSVHWRSKVCTGDSKSPVEGLELTVVSFVRRKCLHWKAKGFILEAKRKKVKMKIGASPKKQKQAFLLHFPIIPFKGLLLLTPRVGLLSSINPFSHTQTVLFPL